MGRLEAGEAGAWVHLHVGVLNKLFLLELAKNVHVCMQIDHLVS